LWRGALVGERAGKPWPEFKRTAGSHSSKGFPDARPD